MKTMSWLPLTAIFLTLFPILIALSPAYADDKVDLAVDNGVPPALEIPPDAVAEGATVLLVAAVIATGGTAAAAIRLLKGVDAELTAFAVFIELVFLNGARQLDGIPLHALVRYD